MHGRVLVKVNKEGKVNKSNDVISDMFYYWKIVKHELKGRM